jgi:hypothetical protein
VLFYVFNIGRAIGRVVNAVGFRTFRTHVQLRHFVPHYQGQMDGRQLLFANTALHKTSSGSLANILNPYRQSRMAAPPAMTIYHIPWFGPEIQNPVPPNRISAYSGVWLSQSRYGV